MSSGFFVEGDGPDWRQVSGFEIPALWVGRLRFEVQVMPSSQNRAVLAGLPLIGAGVADSAVQIYAVEAVNALAGLVSGLIQTSESMLDLLGSLFRGSDVQVRKGVVVAYPWSGVGGLDSEAVEHRQDGGRFKHGAVIAVQDGFGLIGCDALRKRYSLRDVGGMLSIVRFMHLPTHDLAAVGIENQIEIEPEFCDFGGQVRQSQYQISPGPFATWVLAGRCC